MKYVKSFLIVICFCVLLAGCEKKCKHDYQSKITRAATCAQVGEEVFTCKLCQESYTEQIPVLEHNYVIGEVERASTCAVEGLQKYTCQNCGAEKTEPMEKLEHDFGEPTVTKEPNCTEKGIRSAACKNCTETKVVEEIPTNDTHMYTETVVREATCAQKGEGKKTCTLCKHSQTVEYKMESHKYGASEVTKLATCTEEGEKQSKCSVCKKVKKETIALEEHSWSEGSCKEKKVCRDCGKVGEMGDHIYITLSSQGSATMFTASMKEKQCKACGDYKVIFNTAKGEVDFLKSRDDVAKYAKKKGFKVKYGQLDQKREDYASFSVIEITYDGRKISTLTKEGKKCVDSLYSKYSKTDGGVAACTLYIQAIYKQESFGSGDFILEFYVDS